MSFDEDKRCWRLMDLFQEETARRLLPFVRRRLTTRLPATLRMRLLNPWLRFRFLFDG